MNIEADRLSKDCLWRQIHVGATHNTNKSISVSIQPTNIEYHCSIPGILQLLEVSP